MAKLTGKPHKRREQPIQAKVIKRREAPGRTVVSRENQIARLAYDLVEKRMRSGSATSQEVVYFLKMASTQSQLEKIKLESENKLLEAKTEALESVKRIEELYSRAIKSMALYQGREVSDYEKIDLDDD